MAFRFIVNINLCQSENNRFDQARAEEKTSIILLIGVKLAS